MCRFGRRPHDPARSRTRALASWSKKASVSSVRNDLSIARAFPSPSTNILPKWLTNYTTLSRWKGAEAFVIDVGRDRGLRSTYGAVRRAAQLELAEPHFQAVVGEEPADERIAAVEQELDRLGGLKEPDHTR